MRMEMEMVVGMYLNVGFDVRFSFWQFISDEDTRCACSKGVLDDPRHMQHIPAPRFHRCTYFLKL